MSPRPAALITGSTSGIGRAIARRLAQAGYDVTINGFGEKSVIDSVVEEISQSGGHTVRYSNADVTDAAAVEMMIKESIAAFGRIDVLVNNAGAQFTSPIIEFPVEKWKALIDLNLSAAFYTTKAALPTMVTQNYGRIINISSAHGLVASPHKAAYVAAKHGLIGLTKVTALEGSAHGITCNAICPGFVRTPLVDQQIENKILETGAERDRVISDVILAKHAIKKFVLADEVAALVEFLCTPGAASITGASLPIDAGWTAS